MVGDDGDVCVEWTGTAATWVLQRHITRLFVADHLQKGAEGTVKRMHPSGDAFISWHGEGDKWILKDQFKHIAVRESLLASQATDGEQAAATDPLPTFSWTTLLRWIKDRGERFTSARARSACNLLVNALQTWRQSGHATTVGRASVAGRFTLQGAVALRSLDVTLNMLYQWMWPASGPKDVARYLAVICRHELQKMRVPTPRKIDQSDLKPLRELFELMDVQGKGYLTAQDFDTFNFGGKCYASNDLDGDIVQAVCDNQQIDLPCFLELMCGHNMRGHERALRAYVAPEPDDGALTSGAGRGLRWLCRNEVGFNGWVAEEPDIIEVSRMRFVDALEEEVCRLRGLEGSVTKKRSRKGVMKVVAALRMSGCSIATSRRSQASRSSGWSGSGPT